MFSHIMIGTNDLDKAKSFYDNLLSTLEVRPAKVDGHRRHCERSEAIQNLSAVAVWIASSLCASQ